MSKTQWISHSDESRPQEATYDPSVFLLQRKGTRYPCRVLRLSAARSLARALRVVNGMLKKLWEVATSKSLAFLFAAAGLTVGVYGIWFYRPVPALTFDTVSDTKVLDVHASIGKLDITYDGESLKASNRELRILVVKIMNNGAADIAKTSYDPADPIGFEIVRGTLLEPPTLSTSSEYLTHAAVFNQREGNVLLLGPVILESGEWIQLKLLVAAQGGDNPSIRPFGKIAGIKKIQITESANNQTSRPMLDRVFGADSFWIQFARIPGYLVFALGILLVGAVAVLVLLGIFIAPVVMLRDARVNRKRKRFVETYGKTKNIDPADHLVIDEYMRLGSSAVESIKKYLLSVATYNAEQQRLESIRTRLIAQIGDEDFKKFVKLDKPTPVLDFQLAKERGFQVNQEQTVTVNPELEMALRAFERFLRTSGELPPEGNR